MNEHADLDKYNGDLFTICGSITTTTITLVNCHTSRTKPTSINSLKLKGLGLNT